MHEKWGRPSWEDFQYFRNFLEGSTFFLGGGCGGGGDLGEISLPSKSVNREKSLEGRSHSSLRKSLREGGCHVRSLYGEDSWIGFQRVGFRDY